MDTHENYKRQGMTEGHPGNINPNEVNRKKPAKAISETEKLERNESALGINQSLKASAENLDLEIGQIDEETKKMKSQESSNADTADGNLPERDDDRDLNDSTRDWDAENNRTGRHK